ncbi:hypothetical protein NHX12_020006, partial [Muraenolepis orangiensis]
KVPEGSWLCRTCALGLSPRCQLCPKRGGAMKPTRSGTKWAHVSCALWIPEVSIGSPDKMEPITNVSLIPSSRWALLCCVCQDKTGACIQCSAKNCRSAFHVTCGLQAKLQMITFLTEDDEVQFKSLCPKHSEEQEEAAATDQSRGRRGPVKGEEPDEEEKKRGNLRKLKLQQLEEEFSVFVEVEQVAEQLTVSVELVDFLFQYWKLKRKANFNQPLLTPKKEEEQSLARREQEVLLRRLQLFTHLRQDLERVRNLSYMVTRREKLKQSLCRLQEEMFHKQILLLDQQLLSDRDNGTPDRDQRGDDRGGPEAADRGKTVCVRLVDIRLLPHVLPQGGADDFQKKGGKGGKRSGLGSLFDKRSTPKMSKLKEVHSPESELIVKTSEDGGAEGLIFGGGGKDGIFIKQVVPESPAYKNLCVKEGDQILSATVYFDNVSYEDALQIMEHAQAYKVKLCLKRKPEVPEEDPDGHPETIQEEEVTSPEMREKRKTKRHGDARISWPKFPSLGKGKKKSHFRRSHSTSEAEDQTKLELSPTTSDTDSPIKSQEALKGKKKHKVKLNLLKNKGRISAYADQDADTLTAAPLNGVNDDPTKEVSPTHSPELPKIPLDESTPVCITHQFKIPEIREIEREVTDLAKLESPQHRVDLLSVDSTLTTADLTVALADSPTANQMSPDGKKKKKKEKSELKMRIKGKDKSDKQDVKVKSSPKRLQTLGASMEIPDPTSNKNVASHLQMEWPEINTDTQVTDSKDLQLVSPSVQTQEGKGFPKVEFSFGMSDVGILKKSPSKGKEKLKKETENISKGSKQKTDTKKSPFKLPTFGLTGIAMGDKEASEKTVTESLTQDPYDRLSCPSKRQLPKREEIEIPGMEDTSSVGWKKKGIEERQAETAHMSIDVNSVKEAVSKLPGFKLPKVDLDGVPIPEEITVIDANAQRITVKTHGTPTKIVDTKIRGEMKEYKAMGKQSGVEIKTEGHKREDILIPGEETHIQGPKTEKTKEGAFKWSSGTNTGQNKANINDLTSPKKHKGFEKPDIRFPNVAIDLPQLNVSERNSIGSGPLAKVEVKYSKIEPENKDAERTPSKYKNNTFQMAKFGSYTPNILGKEPEMYKRINIEGVTLNASMEGADVDIVAPSGQLKGTEIEGKTTNIKIPNVGISMAKVQGPDCDLNVSKAVVNITLPEDEAYIQLPSAKVELKGPEIDSKVKDSQSKFKMPTFKFPKFGAASPNVSIKIPEVRKDIQIDGELNIPKATVENTLPNVEIEGPSIDLKSTGVEGTVKGSTFKIPNLGISMPKVKGPDVDISLSMPDVDITLPEANAEVTLPDVKLPSGKVEVKGHEIVTEEVDGSSKFKMPEFKLPTFGTSSSNITVDLPDIDKEITFDAKLNIPKATVDIKAPKVEVEGPSIYLKTPEIKGKEKGGMFKMPKVKGQDFDLNISKADLDISSPEVKAEVTLPDVPLPSAKVQVKGPEIDLKVKDVKGSPSNFKMPTFKFPKFGAASPNISVEMPEVEKEIQFDRELNIPEATVDITAPNVEIEGPSIDLKSIGVDGTGKGMKFKMPNLGISMPKVKGPDVDVSLSKPDVDITLPEAKAEVTLPNLELPSAKVEVKGPEFETQEFDGSSKFKMPKFKLPSFGMGSSNITAEIPKVEKDITFDAELNIPKATVDITSPKVEVEGPCIDLKITGPDGKGKRSNVKMPSLGLSMPKIKGPDVDVSLSKPDVDIQLPEAKAEVTLPDVELPSVKVEVKGPKIETEEFDGSAKFKMPKFKLPKFGTGSTNITAEVPDIDNEITFDAELNIPKATMEITAPKVEVTGPSIDLKSTGIEGTGKGMKFKMPNLGISMPKVKGPDVDVSLSKPDVDITLPEAKAEVTLPNLELPSAKVEVKGPEFETQEFDGSSKFKMPKFKLPSFGMGSSNITAEIPKVEKDITFDAELNIPKATVDITSPKVEVEGPCIDLKITGPDGKGKRSNVKMPSLGLSMPKIKGPDVDVSLSKPDVDIQLPEAKAEVTLPDVELPSVKVEVKGPKIETEEFDGSAKFKMPKFKLPKFGTGSTNITAEVPDIDNEITFDAELNIPKATMEITAPKVEVTGPSIDLKSTGIEGTGKGSTFKMPNLGISMPKVKGSDVDVSLSKPDVDITLPEVKADVELSSANVEVKGPEIDLKVKDVKGSPSKFKMPTFKFPKFGAASPNISVEMPEVEKKIQFDGELNIPEATVDITAPNVEIEGPSIDLKSIGVDGTGKGRKFKMPNLGISMPKVKGPDVDVSLSKPDADITLPEAKAEVTLPNLELPSAKVEVKGPEFETQEFDGSSKFKMPKFKLPSFGMGSSNITAEIPKVEKDIAFDAELSIPKATVDITSPKVEVEGPCIDLKITGPDGKGKRSNVKMPSLGLSMPKIKGPDVDVSLSKPDVDIQLPEAKAEVTLPDVELPSVKVEVKGPKIETEEFDGSAKFKMPKFKLPKFGTGSTNITAEVPDIDNEITFDAELNIPKATMEITAPKVEVTGPSIDLKSTGIEGTGKGSTFKMPNLGISMPKVKGSDVDVSLSKPDVDITLPEVKADVELSSANVEVKGPEIDLKVKDVKGSPSKFKMPTFKFPKFGAASPNISVEMPEVEKEIQFDGELNIPEATVDITAPNVEIEGPSIDLKSIGVDGTGKGRKFKMPNLGISMPKVKGPDVDVSLSKPDVDITLPEAEAEVTLPNLELPSAKVEVKGPEFETQEFDGSSKFKMPKFKLPSFGMGSSNITAEIPKVEKDIAFDAELSIPKATVDITSPKVKVEGPCIDLKITGPDGKGKRSNVKMPSLGLSMPKIKGPDVDVSLSKPDVDIQLPEAKAEVTLPDVELPSVKVEVKGPKIETEEFDGSAKFKMPKFKLPKFGTGSTNIPAEVPDIDNEITFDAELNIPKATMEITAPKVEVTGPSIDLKSTGIEGTGKGSTFKMPNLGISMPKVKGSDVDVSLSKPDVDITLPEVKADVELSSANVEVKGPEIDLKVKDVKGSPSKFKMPTFKFPKFGAASPNISVEMPEVEKEIQFDGELNIPEATVDITAPNVEIEGPSIDLKSIGVDGTEKGRKFKMPNLGISMPKVKGPDVDVSLSKPDVDITLPEAEVKVTLPNLELPSAKVEVKGPEFETQEFDGSSKFKMPKFKLPSFGMGSSNITAEIPKVEKDITFDAELNIPKATVDITSPKVEVEGPCIDLKITGPDGKGKRSNVKMPSLGLSMPKIKGPDVDVSLSKPDVDIQLPEAKAEVTLPDVELPSVKVEVKGPKIETEEFDGSSKFKMPKFKLPKFGTGSTNITAEVPDIDNEITFDAELNIPKATMEITAPKVEVTGPSIDLKSTGIEGTGKGSTFKMPNLGISMPKVKGSDVDVSLSKPDVDITLPEVKADVELSSANVEVKGPEIDLKVKDVKGSPSKFKMPTFKFPKFGAASPNISVEMPEVEKKIQFDGELNIPEATVDITAPNVEIEGPSIDLKSIGVDGTGKGRKFKMPNLGISMPKVKGPDVDVSLSKPDADITLPEAKAEVTLPNLELPSAKVEVKGPEFETQEFDGSSKFKMPKFKLPSFGMGSSNITAEIPKVEKDIAFDAELNIPKATVDITSPKVKVKGPCIDLKITGPDGKGKRSNVKMPSLGLSMPKIKGPDVDVSLSKPDVDITLPEAKAEVTLPNLELPSAKVEVKGPELGTQEFDGSSKFKMPKFKLPSFGMGSSNITAEIPKVEKDITFDAELNIPKATVDITSPKVEVEGPCIDLKITGPDGKGKRSNVKMPSLGLSMPKIKGPDVDVSLSKPDVDIQLPEAKAEVTLPDVELPSVKVEVKGPKIETEEFDGSSKFKMPKFKLPKFGTGSTNITAEVPDIDNEITFDAELNIPKATMEITAPKVEVTGPSIDLKSTGIEGTGKGSTFKMPNLGISMPKVKGSDVDVSLSKPDVDITLPEVKADVELSSANVDVKGPEIDLKVKDVKGSPSKFKMPTFKFPKFGAASPNISVEMPEVEKEIQFDGELNIPESTVDITAPNVEIEGPSIDLKSIGVDGTEKGRKFKMPNLGISMPKVKGPDVDVSLSKPDVDITLPEAKAEVTLPNLELPSAKVEVKGPELGTQEFDGSSKFKMPKFKLPSFGMGSSNITAEIPKVEKDITFDAELNIPKATVDITSPKVEVEGPCIDLKITGPDGKGKRSNVKMPSLGLSMPKIKGPDVDVSLSKPDVDIQLPEAKAEVTLPDVELPSVKVEVKGPKIETEEFDGSSKFKMPKFKLPKFGTGSTNITAEVPDIDNEITFDAELNIPKATMEITAPKVEVTGPSIDLKSTGIGGTGKGSTFKMPNLGISMPKVKGSDVDVSLSKPDVDITLPEVKADVELSSANVEVKGPEIDLKVKDVKGSPSKFKMPTFKFPKFGAASPNISVEMPEVEKEIQFDGELNIPEATVDITAPNVEIEGPSIDLKSIGVDGTGKGSKLKMPNLGISMPKVKGPDVDISLSKPDVDITLPEAKAEVTLPNLELPSAKVEVKGPELGTQEFDGSSKFKMPKFKLPSFGMGSSNITAEIPKVEKDITFDAELNIPKATVDITSPKVEVQGPCIDLKITGPDGKGKRSKVKMPSLGLSMPKIKGPDVDVSLSKPDVDIQLPEAKAEVTLPDVELPSVKVEVKGPKIETEEFDGSSKFKMPKFKLPKFGTGSTNITAEVPDIDNEITFDAELNIPKATMEITAPKFEVTGPSIDLKSTGIEGTGKGSTFKMPNLGISMPKVKGSDVDVSLSKPDVDITLPDVKADVELSSANVEVKGPEIDLKVKDVKGSPSKFKMPTFKFPKFGAASPNISVEMPEVEKEIQFDGELNIPEATVDITAPNVEIEGPSIDLKSIGVDGTGKGSKLKMPNLGISMPKVKGPDVDVSLSKPDVDITLPEAKAEVTLPNLELPSAKVEVKGPELGTQEFDGSSKFKMPKFKLPSFGMGSSNITAEIPEVEKDITFDAELNIPKATVDITSPKVEVQGPCIDLKITGPDVKGKRSKVKMPSLGLSMPKIKGPDVDVSLSKPDVDIQLPEAKAEVTLPDVELPSVKVEVKGPKIETEEFDGSSKFKMPKFKLPKFGTGSTNITAEVPDIDNEITFDAELNIPKATMEITAPKFEVTGPSIDLKSTGIEGTGKGSTFKMPNLGISMPKVKGSDVDVSLSKPDVDITLPDVKADVELSSANVEVKGPEIDLKVKDVKGSPSKFKMPTFKFPKFGAASPNISVEMPEVEKEIQFDGELNIPEATVDITAPNVEIEGPSIDLKSIGVDDVDITLPEAKAEVTLPNLELPSAKVEVKGPELGTQEFDGSSKFKMPKFKLPSFGMGSSNITAEIPEVEKDITFDAELNIPKATVDITSPKVEVQGPCIDLKITGPDGKGKRSKVKMPSLGLSMPKIKGPDVDVSLSKPDVDIQLPEAKAEVTLPDVELPSVKVEVKGPKIETEEFDGSSKFKMPKFKLPKFGTGSTNITAEVPDIDNEITFDAELNIPKATMEITAPKLKSQDLP